MLQYALSLLSYPASTLLTTSVNGSADASIEVA
jgi:hypothetical protein